MSQFKRMKYVVVNKAERNWRPEEHFDMRHKDEEFGVCSADFHSCFGSVFPCYVPFPMFWNSNVHPVLLYVGSM